MNFGYFVQDTGSMKKHFWYFLIPLSGQASGSRRCWKMHCSAEALAFRVLKLYSWISGILFNILALRKNIFGTIWHHPQGKLQAQGGVGRRPWHSEFWSCKHEFQGILFNTLALWKNKIGSFWYCPLGQLQAHADVGKYSPGALAYRVFKLL